MFQIHHIFCYIFSSQNDGIKPTHLCEPLINVIYAFIEIPEPISSQYEFDNLYESMSKEVIQENNDNLFCDKYPSIWKSLSCTKNIEFVILLSQRRGGSNYALQTLSNHPQIIGYGHEITMRFFHFHCTQFVKNKNQKCKIKNILDIINTWFVNKTLSLLPINCDYNKKQIFLVKLQIEQFWTKHYKDFIHYISCNNITIIHYLRGSTVSSYWSHSADAIERVQTKNILSILSKPRRNKQLKQNEKEFDSLWIDPVIVKQYVNKIDKLHEQIGYLMQYYPLNYIKYQRFYYENFIDSKYGKFYWYGLQGFLGIDIVLNGNETWMIREHPIPCYVRIKNWNEIQIVLNGTNSVYACQMIQS